MIEPILEGASRSPAPAANGLESDASPVIPSATTGVSIRTVPNPSPLAVAIDGPGLFVLQDGGVRSFSRLGDFRVAPDGSLRDANGRAVVGFRVDDSGQPVSGALTLSVDSEDIATRRFDAYAIDERGVFRGVVRRTDARSGKRLETNVPLGRLALAIFPAPQRLHKASETTFLAPPAAGAPKLFAPGDPNVARLKAHALESGFSNLEDYLSKAWHARRQAELRVGIAAAEDQCTRVALGLVK